MVRSRFGGSFQIPSQDEMDHMDVSEIDSCGNAPGHACERISRPASVCSRVSTCSCGSSASLKRQITIKRTPPAPEHVQVRTVSVKRTPPGPEHVQVRTVPVKRTPPGPEHVQVRTVRAKRTPPGPEHIEVTGAYPGGGAKGALPPTQTYTGRPKLKP